MYISIKRKAISSVNGSSETKNSLLFDIAASGRDDTPTPLSSEAFSLVRQQSAQIGRLFVCR
jgi:hypothetical protein